MLGDWFDPQGQADQSDLIEEVHRQDSHSDAFLTGRHTFEAMRGYWPEQTEDPTGVTAYLNDVPKYVVSSMINDSSTSATPPHRTGRRANLSTFTVVPSSQRRRAVRLPRP